MPKESEPKPSKRSITLTFTGDDDIALFDAIEADAIADRRSTSQYLLMWIDKNYKSRED